MAIIKPTNINFVRPVNTYPQPRATGFNWTSGYSTTFHNGVPDSYSDAPRNRLADDQGNLIDGGSGDDFIAAGTGADTVRGGAEKDYIYGMDKDDVLFGDGGNDLIYGDGNRPGGNSVVWTLPESHGNDVIDGGDGDAVHIYGFDQNDVFNSSSISSFAFADGRSFSIPERLAREFAHDGSAGDSANDYTNNLDRRAA